MYDEVWDNDPGNIFETCEATLRIEATDLVEGLTGFAEITVIIDGDGDGDGLGEFHEIELQFGPNGVPGFCPSTNNGLITRPQSSTDRYRTISISPVSGSISTTQTCVPKG